MTVEHLRLIHAAEFQVRVERDVEVDDLVDEPLHAEIVDEELDLHDLFLDAFGVVGHGWHGARSGGCDAGGLAARGRVGFREARPGDGRGQPQTGPSSVTAGDRTRTGAGLARANPAPASRPLRRQPAPARDPTHDVAVAAAAAFAASPCSHLVVTDFGRVMGSPIARAMTACEHTPRARDTLNSTV